MCYAAWSPRTSPHSDDAFMINATANGNATPPMQPLFGASFHRRPLFVGILTGPCNFGTLPGGIALLARIEGAF